MRHALLLIAISALIGAGTPALAGGWHGKPHIIDECEAACLEDAAICLDAVGDELKACLSTDEDWMVCFEAAKVGAKACATQAELCLSACDD